MKKNFLLSVLMLLPMVASAQKGSRAQEVLINGVRIFFRFNSSQLTASVSPIEATGLIENLYITDYSGFVEIPSNVTYDGSIYTVTAVADGAFYHCTNLTSVTLPSTLTSIGTSSFLGCTGLESITIPENVTSIGTSAIAGCTGLTDVYCLAEEVPSVPSKNPKVFGSKYDQDNPIPATLHVPAASIEAYSNSAPWNTFSSIVAITDDDPIIPQRQKCASPTVSFKDGKLHFECETEGVEYVYSTPSLTKTTDGNGITLSAFSVMVYTKKNGYDDSDIVKTTIYASGKKGDVDGDGNVDAADHVELTKIIMGK